MEKERRYPLISLLERYVAIPAAQKDQLEGKLSYQVLPKDGHFLRPGDSQYKIGLITKGLLRVYCLDYNGVERNLSFRTKGHIIAPYTPFVANKQCWYSIQSLSDTELLVMDLEKLPGVLKNHDCWKELEKKYLTQLLIEKENRERSLLIEDATTRYLTFLETHSNIAKDLSQMHISSYLGITPVSLSRIKAKLKKKNGNLS